MGTPPYGKFVNLDVGATCGRPRAADSRPYGIACKSVHSASGSDRALRYTFYNLSGSGMRCRSFFVLCRPQRPCNDL